MSLRLKHVATLRAGGTPDTSDPMYWADEGGTPWVAIGDMSAGVRVTSTAKSVTDAGAASRNLPIGQPETVLLAMYASVGATAILGVSATWNQAILGIEPRRACADGRYLRYWLESTRPGWAQHVRSNTQDNLNAEIVGNASLPEVAVKAQVVIADYLDAETAHIDQVLRSRTSMARLVAEREEAHLALLLGDWQTIPTMTLRQARTRLVTGPFGTQLAASEYETGGTPVINPTHIADGRIDPDPDVAVPAAVAVRLDRHRLEPGDIVMGRKGDVGRAAVIGRREAGWICGSDSIAIRTDPRRVLPGYLALVMSAGYYRQQLEARSTGAMVANVNESILMGFRIPAVPLGRQRGIVAAGHEVTRLRRQAVAAIEGQAALLLERRQTLIAAAVTGQLAIPGVVA